MIDLVLDPLRTLPPHNPNTTTPFCLELHIIMAYPKTKNDVVKLRTKEHKPIVNMIDEDGPIVESPKAIDLGESYPEGPSQDVRVFAFALTSMFLSC